MVTQEWYVMYIYRLHISKHNCIQDFGHNPKQTKSKPHLHLKPPKVMQFEHLPHPVQS